MIAVNQLSCGAGDSLSEGMRDAQIAIGAPTLVHRDDFQPPSHPDCSTQRGESSNTQLLLDCFSDIFNPSIIRGTTS